MGNESSKIKTLQIVKINPGSVSHDKNLLPFMHTIVSYNGNKIWENSDIAKLAFEWEEGELHLDLLDLRTEKGFSVIIPKKESTPLGMSVKYHEGVLRLFSVFVSKISPGCPAQQCGLIEKDYIIGVEGVSCDSENMLLQYIELKGKEGMFLLVFNDKLNYIRRVEFKVTSEQAFEGAEVIVGILYSVKHDQKQVGMEHDSEKIKKDIAVINEKKSKVVSKMMNEEAVKEDEIKIEDLKTLEKDLDEKEVVPRDVDVIAENLSDYREEIESKPPVEKEKSSLEKELEDIKKKINEEEIKENSKVNLETKDIEEIHNDSIKDEQRFIHGKDQFNNIGESVKEQNESQKMKVNECLKEKSEVGEICEDQSKSNEYESIKEDRNKYDQLKEHPESYEEDKNNVEDEILIHKENTLSKESDIITNEEIIKQENDHSTDKESSLSVIRLTKDYDIGGDNVENERKISKNDITGLNGIHSEINKDDSVDITKDLHSEIKEFDSELNEERKTLKNKDNESQSNEDHNIMFDEENNSILHRDNNLNEEYDNMFGKDYDSTLKIKKDNNLNEDLSSTRYDEDYNLTSSEDQESLTNEDLDSKMFNKKHDSNIHKKNKSNEDYDNFSNDTYDSSIFGGYISIISEEKSHRTTEDNDIKLNEKYDSNTFSEDIVKNLEKGTTVSKKLSDKSSVFNEEHDDINQFKENERTYSEDYDKNLFKEEYNHISSQDNDIENFIGEDRFKDNIHRSNHDSDYESNLFYDSTFDVNGSFNRNKEIVTPRNRESNLNENLRSMSKDEHESNSILSTDVFEHEISTVVNESKTDKDLQDKISEEHSNDIFDSQETQSDNYDNLSDIYEELDKRSHTDSNFSINDDNLSDIFSSQKDDIKYSFKSKNKSEGESVDDYYNLNSSILSNGLQYSFISSKESTITDISNKHKSTKDKSPIPRKHEKQIVKSDDHEPRIDSIEDERDESNISIYETQKDLSSEERSKTFDQMIRELSIDIKNKKMKKHDEPEPKVEEKRYSDGFHDYNDFKESTPNRDKSVKNPTYVNKIEEDFDSHGSKDVFLDYKLNSLDYASSKGNKKNTNYDKKSDNRFNEQHKTIKKNDPSFESHNSTTSDNFSTEVHNTSIYESNFSEVHDLSTSEKHSVEDYNSSIIQKPAEEHRSIDLDKPTEENRSNQKQILTEFQEPTVKNNIDISYKPNDKQIFNETTLKTVKHSSSPLKDVFIKNFDDESISDYHSFLDSNKNNSEPSWESTSFTSLKPVDYDGYVPQTDILENEKIISPTKSGVEKVESVIVIEKNSESED